VASGSMTSGVQHRVQRGIVTGPLYHLICCKTLRNADLRARSRSMSAMPRKRRLAAKMSPVAMGQNRRPLQEHLQLAWIFSRAAGGMCRSFLKNSIQEATIMKFPRRQFLSLPVGAAALPYRLTYCHSSELSGEAGAYHCRISSRRRCRYLCAFDGTVALGAARPVVHYRESGNCRGLRRACAAGRLHAAPDLCLASRPTHRRAPGRLPS
jgi:hypothetical protein